MATLTAVKFETAGGAQQAVDLLQSLQKQELIKVHDAAVVSWPQGAKKPKTKQMVNLVGVGALDGAFWGMLFGLLFFAPFLGLALGAAMGALGGKFADYGIDDNFIKEVQGKVTEGSSALFLLSSDAVTDRVVDAMKDLPKFELIASNLSKEQEANLRAEFESAAEA